MSVFSEANAAIIKEYSRKMLGGCRTARAINSGLCEVWADYVIARMPGAQKEIGLDGNHVAVRYHGRLYDAECHTGTNDWNGLPFAERMQS